MSIQKVYVRINATTGVSNDWGKKPVSVKEASKLYFHFSRLANKAYDQWAEAERILQNLAVDEWRLIKKELEGWDIGDAEYYLAADRKEAQAASSAGLQWYNRYNAAMRDIVQGLTKLGYNAGALFDLID